MQASTLTGKPRQRPYVSYDNSPLPTMADKLLFILMYLRKATTQDIFGEVFGMPQPVANQWIHRLHGCLNQALAILDAIRRGKPTTWTSLTMRSSSTFKMARSGQSNTPRIPKSKRPSIAARRTPYRQEQCAGQCPGRDRASDGHL